MPVVTMIAGPNGSGKTTLIARLRDCGIDFGDYLNADDIAAGMAGPREAVALAAQVAVREGRKAALAERRDHTFETVLSHPSHIDHLRAARAAGFEVLVYFVATDDPAISIGRVANRVLHGGHDVPVDRIEARYWRSIANLHGAVAVADEGAVFDNSSTREPMQLLATLRDGHVEPVIALTDSPAWWVQFLTEWRREREQSTP